MKDERHGVYKAVRVQLRSTGGTRRGEERRGDMVRGTDRICVMKEKKGVQLDCKIKFKTPSYLEINWIQIQISV